MRAHRRPLSPLYPKIRFAFTDHPLTVWAGAILLRLYFELIGLRGALSPILHPFTKRSPNQIPAVDVLLAWFYGLALGIERFEHLTRYRPDPLLPHLLGVTRFPSPDTVQRLFKAFTYRHVTDVSEALMRFTLGWMPAVSLGHTLDLDSTVLCRYGTQEGSRKGYNPVKPGRPSQHPLLAWLSERRRVLWATLRAGHAGAANGVRGFLAQALTLLPAGHRVALVRADAGFYETPFLEALEQQDLPYIIVARLTGVVRRVVLQRIPEAEWRGVGPGIDVADIQATFPTWRGHHRRFVCLRQTLSERPHARGRRLIRVSGIHLPRLCHLGALSGRTRHTDVCGPGRQRKSDQGTQGGSPPGSLLSPVLRRHRCGLSDRLCVVQLAGGLPRDRPAAVLV